MPDARDDVTESARLNLQLIALALGLLVLCVAVYAGSLHGPLFFDDLPNLLDNRLMQISGREFDDWRSAIISNNSGPLHRPVAMLTFTLNYVVAGDFTPLVFKGRISRFTC